MPALKARAAGLTTLVPHLLLSQFGNSLRPIDVDSLDVSDNELTTLAVADGAFPLLTSLSAAHNSVCIVSALPPSLTRLDLSYNKLGPAEASFLRNLTNLQELDLSYNLFTEVSFLGSNRALHTLRLAGNRISTLTGISNLANLASLDLRNNLVEAFEDLRCLSANPVQHLSLRGNPITKLQSYRFSVLHILPALESLDGEKLPQTPSRGRPAWQNPGAVTIVPDRKFSQQSEDMPPPPPPPSGAPMSPQGAVRNSPGTSRATPPRGSSGRGRQRTFQAVPIESNPASTGESPAASTTSLAPRGLGPAFHSAPAAASATASQDSWAFTNGASAPGSEAASPAPHRRPVEPGHYGLPPAPQANAPNSGPLPPPPPPPAEVPHGGGGSSASFASIAAAAAALLAEATPSTTRGPTPPPEREERRRAGPNAQHTEAMVKLITKLADTLSLEEIQLIAESDLATSLFTTIIDDSALMLEPEPAPARPLPPAPPRPLAPAPPAPAPDADRNHSPVPSDTSSEQRLREEIMRSIPPALPTQAAGASPPRRQEAAQATLRSPEAAAAAAAAVQELAELLEAPGVQELMGRLEGGQELSSSELRFLADRLAAAAAVPEDPSPAAAAAAASPPAAPPGAGAPESPEEGVGTGRLEGGLVRLRADRDALEERMASLEARLASLRPAEAARASTASSGGSPPARGRQREWGGPVTTSPGVASAGGRDETGSAAGNGSFALAGEWSSSRAEREELMRRCAYLEYRIAKAEAQAVAQNEEMQEKLSILRERLAAVERERSSRISTAAPSPARAGSPSHSSRTLQPPAAAGAPQTRSPPGGAHQSRSPGVPPREPRITIDAAPAEPGPPRVRPPPPTPTTPAVPWSGAAEAAAEAEAEAESERWRDDLFDALQQLQALERGALVLRDGRSPQQSGEGLAAFLRSHRSSLDAGTVPPLSQAQQHRAAELARLRSQLQQARVDRETLLDELNSCMSALQEIQVTSRSPSPSPVARVERVAALAAALAAPPPDVRPGRRFPRGPSPVRPAPARAAASRRPQSGAGPRERAGPGSPERGPGPRAGRALQSVDSLELENAVQLNASGVPHYALPLKRHLSPGRRRSTTRSPLKQRPVLMY